MENITQALTDLLHKEGCTLFGFADLSPLPEAPRKKLPVGITVGCVLHTDGVSRQENGAMMLTNVHGGGTNEKLARYETIITQFLKERKYKVNTKNFVKEVITDKTVATLGGLGWIGKSAMLTTKTVGPALRLLTLLTNAPLLCNTPITTSLCPPDCVACATICPANAILNKKWETGVHRDEFFNVEACKKARIKQGGQCWSCIAICPLAVRGLFK